MNCWSPGSEDYRLPDPSSVGSLGSEKPARSSRDYVDTAAALEHYSVEQIIGLARRLDPCLTDRDFADAVQLVDQWGDGVFSPFGLGPKDVAELRTRFAAWSRT